MKKVKKKWILYPYHRPCKLLGEQEGNIIRITCCVVLLKFVTSCGRYGTQWEQGSVTTFKAEDLNMLHTLLSQTPEPLSKAGLHPTADQIELYAYHLPNATLSNLMVSEIN